MIAYKCMFPPGFQFTECDPGDRDGGQRQVTCNPLLLSKLSEVSKCMLVPPPRKDQG